MTAEASHDHRATDGQGPLANSRRMDPLLGSCSLAELRQRKSFKWRTFPPDVLPAFVAEMDFTLAEPITEAVTAALVLGDSGYAHMGELGEAFARFAAGRFGWRPDLAWLDCRALGLGADPAAVFRKKGKVALSPGPDFGAQGYGFARLNMGTSPGLMEEAVRRMASAVRPP